MRGKIVFAQAAGGYFFWAAWDFIAPELVVGWNK